MFAIKKLIDPNFRKIPWTRVSWKSLAKEDVFELFSQSSVVLDIHHPMQSGLTMRTIECIGAEKKILTTNLDIVNYDFYNPRNILVIDRVNPVVNQDFFESAYEKLPPDVYNRYSLKSWLNEIFSD